MNTLSFESRAETLENTTLRRLAEVASSCGADWNIALLAVAAVLVHRHVGWDTVEIGWSHLEDDELTAAQNGWSLISVNLAHDPTFRDLVSDVAHATETVVPTDRGDFTRSSRRVTYVLQSPRQLHRLPDGSARGTNDDSSLPKTVSIAVMLMANGTLNVKCVEGDPDDPLLSTRPFARRLVSLAAGAGRDPASRVSELPMLDAAERAQTLAAWLPTFGSHTDRPVHELLSLTANRMDAAPALTSLDGTLTFRDLDYRSNQLAHHLRERGVGAHTRVGICLERSGDAIVAIFGTLKAGGAYLFIDPYYPEDRMRQMLTECDVRVVVTSAEWFTRAAADGIDVVRLDGEMATIATQPITPLRVSVSIDDPAYILYTSGTAGRPKAILGMHRSILNGLCDVPFRRDDPEEICSLDSSLCFGLSLARLFLPLLCGRHLVILPEGAERDLTELVSFWEEAAITNIVLVTPLCRRLLAFGSRLTARLSQVRTVAVGGSPITSDLMTQFRTLMPQAVMLVGYASSEAGGVIAKRTLTQYTGSSGSSVGRPYLNTSVYILDNRLEPVPAGVAGEIYIAAPHLSLGYVGQPGLTAERYVANPFGALPGERMFRTGDKGRYAANGEIEVMGRIDDTVKVRGFRIDLQELESTLTLHSAVAAAAVVPRVVSSESQLVAYVVPQGESSPTSASLREFLLRRLPSYMIPSRFVAVSDLPLTPVGKVDRGRLPDVGAERPVLESPYVSPTNETEMQLVRLLEEVFEMDGIGIDDHFVELGGDSILAAILGSRICDAFDVDFSIANVFELPTVRELAIRLRSLEERT